MSQQWSATGLYRSIAALPEGNVTLTTEDQREQAMKSSWLDPNHAA
ncbi:hypothetical protein [Streptomyces sp. TLI_55]|nr:hypothetical protein [Streptomyces sp. TLI_55]